MGLFGKLFKKKDDDFDFDKIVDDEMGQDPMSKPDDFNMGSEPMTEKSHFDEPTPPHLDEFNKPKFSAPLQNNQQPSPNRDLELINSKLDTVKALLNSMDQRMANLEKAAGIQKKEKLW